MGWMYEVRLMLLRQVLREEVFAFTKTSSAKLKQSSKKDAANFFLDEICELNELTVPWSAE